MTFEKVVKSAREGYPHFNYIKDDLDFLEEVETHLLKLSKCDDLTPFEMRMLDLLPFVQEFLQ